MQQQTEALRQQNQKRRQGINDAQVNGFRASLAALEQESDIQQTGPTWQPEIGARSPYFRYMSPEGRRDLLDTMPEPTGNAKKDERAWDKWWHRFGPGVQRALPAWSSECYEKVRRMFELLGGPAL